MIRQYPTDREYKKIVDDYVKLRKMQDFLQDEFGLLVCTNKTGVISDVSRKVFFGHQDFHGFLQKEALDTQTSTKASAFRLHSDASQRELISDLRELKRTVATYGEKRVRVSTANMVDENISLELDYTIERAGKTQALAEEEKTTELLIRNTDDELMTVEHEYEKVNEETAVKEFIHSWSEDRMKDERSPIERENISISQLSLLDRISLVRDLLSSELEHWSRRNVEGVDVKRDEEIGDDDEDDLDAELEGIRNAALSGNNLDANDFVHRCEDNGFYFTRSRVRYRHKTEAKEIIIQTEFKEERRDTFEISIVREYEEIDDEMKKTSFRRDERKQIRDEFRELVMDLYEEYSE